MPAPVHAILVARPDGRIPSALHLKRTLAALEAQKRRPDALTVVLCGTDDALHDLAASSGAEAVVTAPASTTYAKAVALAVRRVDEGSSVWLLAQDTAPEPDALARLVGALELSPSVAIAAPKLVRWEDRDAIVSLGVTMTRLGRAVELADGEYDQGQHDGDADVLGSDVRGVLVRGEARAHLLPDPALAGAEEGLDMGVRARLAGWRISLVPGARIAVAGDGVAGVPSGHGRWGVRRAAYAQRTAQLHRRLAYAEPYLVPVHWLTILPLAIWRTLAHIVAKAPGLTIPEWRAAATAAVRWPSIARSRRVLRSGRTSSWARIAPLRRTRAQLRDRLGSDDYDDAGGVPRRSELRFFTGGGAWAVLGALVVSIASFTTLLAWPVLGGGALLPLRDTVSALWADAAYGVRATGIDEVGPADPFAGVVAVLGSLWPGAPSFALVLVWVLALPLATLGGWFAATRLTERSALRIVAAIAWALAPTFLAALVLGRPAAVIVHLLLPWLFYVGSVTHRSWGAAGAASLVLVAVVACAPVLAPGLLVIWVLALVVVLATRAGRGLWRVLWVVVPAVVVFTPLAWAQWHGGNLMALFADVGLPWAGPQVGADAAGRALLAAGFPTTDPAGWGAMLTGLGIEASVWWVPLLTVPLAVAALVSPLTPRWTSGIVLLGVALIGLGTAFMAVSVALAHAQSVAVPLWPGTGLSLAWIGVVGAALVTLDTGIAPRPALIRPVLAALVVAGVLVIAVAPLTAVARGEALITNGPTSTLPAYVAASGRDDASVGTLVLTPQNAGGVAADVVWGQSETLGGQATIQTTRTEATEADAALADLVADLVTPSTVDAAAELRELGCSFVLLAPPTGTESDDARAFRLLAVTSIDQRAGLENVGETAKGVLWKVAGDVTVPPGRTSAQEQIWRIVTATQLAVLAIALLLAVPTAASRRAARNAPRVVGPTSREAL
ncbi:MAG TPA: glycosyltransferase [Microbacterium sp.]|uniref:glycosyltransferase n=1 Tax=Microbacterium sp. TaxID=51671 RepID=UPI002C35ECCA|nr:glycosyltransferase [Microbacterium sp.]HWI30321.1 glycosyltransferase [Microbacterium sp.]